MNLFPSHQIRSRLSAILLVVAIGAYVPACCCWTQSMVGWLTGAGAAEAGSDCHACSHDCDSEAPGQPAPTPGHERECACGSQDRYLQPSTNLIPAPDAVVAAWIQPTWSIGVDRTAPIRALSVAGGWSAAGRTTLLRLHCALIV